MKKYHCWCWNSPKFYHFAPILHTDSLEMDASSERASLHQELPCNPLHAMQEASADVLFVSNIPINQKIAKQAKRTQTTLATLGKRRNTFTWISGECWGKFCEFTWNREHYVKQGNQVNQVRNTYYWRTQYRNWSVSLFVFKICDFYQFMCWTAWSNYHKKLWLAWVAQWILMLPNAISMLDVNKSVRHDISFASHLLELYTSLHFSRTNWAPWVTM